MTSSQFPAAGRVLTRTRPDTARLGSGDRGPQTRTRRGALLRGPRGPAPRDRPLLPRPPAPSPRPRPSPTRRSNSAVARRAGGCPPRRPHPAQPSPCRNWLADAGWRGWSGFIFFRIFPADHIPAPRSRSPAPCTYTLHRHTHTHTDTHTHTHTQRAGAHRHAPSLRRALPLARPPAAHAAGPGSPRSALRAPRPAAAERSRAGLGAAHGESAGRDGD